MKNSEAAQNATQRANLYGFLATLFRAEPDVELIHRLADADYITLLRGAGADLEASYFQRPEAEVLEELAVEYTRLFIGPGRHISPHASANMPDEGGSLWGKSTSDAVARIHEAGLDYDPDYHGLPDHVSVEFELMAALTGREAEAWRAGEEEAALSQRQLQAAFLEEHLGHWLPEFCRRIIEQAELALYGEMAKLTKAFLEAERADLAAEGEAGTA